MHIILQPGGGTLYKKMNRYIPKLKFKDCTVPPPRQTGRPESVAQW